MTHTPHPPIPTASESFGVWFAAALLEKTRAWLLTGEGCAQQPDLKEAEKC